MDTLLYVYNPHAGRDRSRATLDELIPFFTAAGYLVTAYPTQAPGDATGFLAAAGGLYDRVVVAGGDGTLAEAVAGLLQLSEPPVLGYIPAGSTNDFSKNLALPESLAQQARVAIRGDARLCDVGLFNGKPFVYVAAFGAFADVSFSTPRSTKNLLGYTAYLLESVKRLPTIKPYHIRADLDGETVEGDFLYGMVSNTRSVAGFSHFPPGNPQLDDGRLEVTFISPARDIIEMQQLGVSLFLSGAEVQSSMIHSYSAARVHIECEEELLWSLDGENGGAHRAAEVSVLPKAIRIMFGETAMALAK